MKVKSESEVTQSCLTLCDPMDRSPPGSSIHGIFQARVLEWGVIIAFSIYLSNIYVCQEPCKMLEIQELKNKKRRSLPSLLSLWLSNTNNSKPTNKYVFQIMIGTIKIMKSNMEPRDLHKLIPILTGHASHRTSLLFFQVSVNLFL